MRPRAYVASAAQAVLVLGLAASATTGAAAVQAPAPTGDLATGTYVVLLRPDPLAFAHAPKAGHRLHAMSASARAYRSSLLDVQSEVRETAGIDEVLYSYTTVIDGFAARLTPAQVTALQREPEVVSVQPSRTEHLDSAPMTAATRRPELHPSLRLDHAATAWQQVGGVTQAGRGVVVGVVDSGIWPENPSFAGVPASPSELRTAFPRFHGGCEHGEQWSTGLCDDKIVGARWFVAGFGEDRVSAAEYLSARDASGHGSHVAAIAAGNAGVDVTIDGQGYGHLSGVAPAAGIAVYKACWTAPDPSDDGCSTADLVAAVDRAVQDGVDVLNVSASGQDDGPGDPLEIAFLGAATAGVFVSASAGDNGPASGTVAHPSPWVTTVAAGTQVTYDGGVRLGNGRLLVGAMVSNRRVAESRLVDAGHAAAAGVKSRAASLCEPGTLDAAKVDGTIVVCRRGQVARVDKSAAVQQAGGLGMVLINTAPETTDADVHAVPTVHLGQHDGRVVLRYAHAAPHPHATLDPAATMAAPVPQLAVFSSRGPAAGTGGDNLKPDLSAPGVSVVSAVASNVDHGRLWDLASGTSMAAPQVAGVATLIEQRHPGWSPAAIRSALMTTAGPFADSSTPFGHGAGNIRADRALDPGLVYDAGRAGWLAYLHGLGIHLPDTDSTPAIDPSNLNQASIAVGGLVGRQTVTRRVTNVSGHAETYQASLSGLPGIAARIAPSTLRLPPGRSARFHVILTAQRAAGYTTFASGQLRWTGSRGHVVTSPVVVRPESFASPAELSSPSSAGSVTVRGTAGVTGHLHASIVGAAAAIPFQIYLEPGSFDPAEPDASDITSVQEYAIAAGTPAARFEVSALADVNLYVYRDGHLLQAASSPSDSEQVTLEHPRAGVYDVYLVAPSGRSDLAEPVATTFTGWVLRPGSDAGLRLDDARTMATGSEQVGWRLGWSTRPAGTRTFAELRFHDTTARTHVTIG